MPIYANFREYICKINHKKMSEKLKKLRLISLIVLLSVTVSACNKDKEVEEEVVIKKQVKVQDIERQTNVDASLTVSGTVTPKQYSIIRSLTPGTLRFLMPVGSDINVGQALFSIQDQNIESGYFNAAQNLEQTQISTNQNVQQAELSLSSSKARLDLAKTQYESTVAQTKQAEIVVKDAGVVSYNSAYNVLSQALNFLSKGNIDDKEYKYKNIITPYSQFRTETSNKFPSLVDKYKRLNKNTDQETLLKDLSKMQSALNSAKSLIDDTAVLLQNAIKDSNFSESTIANDTLVNTNYQTQINQYLNGVISSINNINNTETSNSLAITQAQAQLDLANIEYNNTKIALENANQGALLQVNAAKSQFDSLAYNYSNLSLAAPFSGTVISHYVKEGEQVSVGQQLLELGDLSIVEIVVDVDVDFAKAITLGDKVLIDKNFQGYVSEIEPIGDLSSGKVAVTVQSEEAEGNLTPGSIAEVEFKLLYKDVDTIVIPIKAATIEASGNYVFLVDENNNVSRRSVSLGRIFGDKVSVISGLEEGDRLILLNGVFVADGDEVEIITE